MPTITINIARRGASFSGGGYAEVGRMWYSLSDSNGISSSYGFAPGHGATGIDQVLGAGQENTHGQDDDLYQGTRDLAKTIEITQVQYDAMQSFGIQSERHGFDINYNEISNKGIAFTWKAIQLGELNINDFSGWGRQLFGDATPLDADSFAALAREDNKRDDQVNAMPRGLPADNRMYGLDGNEQLTGSKGNAPLRGGTGNDTLIGGMGKDNLHGGPGNDLLFGGTGKDMAVLKKAVVRITIYSRPAPARWLPLCASVQNTPKIPRTVEFPYSSGKTMMKSDTQLQQDVLAELKWEASVNAADIGVEVKDGVVTLAGHVSNYAEKWGAERAAQRVSGIKALAIEMDVRLLGLSVRSDGDIAQAVENVLQWMSVLPKDAIKVMVENGWITLSGEVEWQYQKTAATGAVRYLLGVRGVSDQISIAPKLALQSIESEIEAALNRRAMLNAARIGVKVSDSEVTLSGTVNTWAEHDLAWTCAWSTPGVRKVIDDIKVTH